VGPVAKRLIGRTTACTEGVLLSLFQLDRDGLATGDFGGIRHWLAPVSEYLSRHERDRKFVQNVSRILTRLAPGAMGQSTDIDWRLAARAPREAQLNPFSTVCRMQREFTDRDLSRPARTGKTDALIPHNNLSPKISIIAGSHRHDSESTRTALYIKDVLHRINIEETYLLDLERYPHGM
jgi:hypothetical protein